MHFLLLPSHFRQAVTIEMYVRLTNLMFAHLQIENFLTIRRIDACQCIFVSEQKKRLHLFV